MINSGKSMFIQTQQEEKQPESVASSWNAAHKELQQQLSRDNGNSIFVLHGEAQSGKTTFLNHFADAISNNVHVVNVNLNFAHHPYSLVLNDFLFAQHIRKQFSHTKLFFSTYDLAIAIHFYKLGILNRYTIRHQFGTESRNLIAHIWQLLETGDWSNLQNDYFSILTQFLGHSCTPYFMHRKLTPEIIDVILCGSAQINPLQLLIQDLHASKFANKIENDIVFLIDHMDRFSNGTGIWNTLAYQKLLSFIDECASVSSLQIVLSATSTLLSEDVAFQVKSRKLKTFPLPQSHQTDFSVTATQFNQNTACDIISFLENLKSLSTYERGLVCDMVALASQDNRHIIPDEFLTVFKRYGKRNGIIKKFLRDIGRETAYAWVALSAARYFDLNLYTYLGNYLSFDANASSFKSILSLSFVEAYNLNDLHPCYCFKPKAKEDIQNYSQKSLLASHRVLEIYYREKMKTGDDLAIVEAIYHLNFLHWEKSIVEWVQQVEAAMANQQNVLLLALIEVIDQLNIETDYWQGRVKSMLARYLFSIDENQRAAHLLEKTIDHFKEAREECPDDFEILNSYGVALLEYGKYLKISSNGVQGMTQIAEAQLCFETAIEKDNCNISALTNKALIMFYLAERYSLPDQSTERIRMLKDAHTTIGEALRQAPLHKSTIIGYVRIASRLAEEMRRELEIDQAIELLQTALEKLTKASQSTTDDSELIELQVKTLQRLANYEHLLGYFHDSNTHFSEALAKFNTYWHSHFRFLHTGIDLIALYFDFISARIDFMQCAEAESLLNEVGQLLNDLNAAWPQHNELLLLDAKMQIITIRNLKRKNALPEKIDQAIEALEKKCVYLQWCAGNSPQFSEIQSTLHELKSERFYEKNDYRNAIAEHEHCIALCENCSEQHTHRTLIQLVQKYIMHSNLYRKIGDTNQAIKYLERAGDSFSMAKKRKTDRLQDGYLHWEIQHGLGLCYGTVKSSQSETYFNESLKELEALLKKAPQVYHLKMRLISLLLDFALFNTLKSNYIYTSSLQSRALELVDSLLDDGFCLPEVYTKKLEILEQVSHFQLQCGLYAEADANIRKANSILTELKNEEQNYINLNKIEGQVQLTQSQLNIIRSEWPEALDALKNAELLFRERAEDTVRLRIETQLTFVDYYLKNNRLKDAEKCVHTAAQLLDDAQKALAQRDDLKLLKIKMLRFSAIIAEKKNDVNRAKRIYNQIQNNCAQMIDTCTDTIVLHNEYGLSLLGAAELSLGKQTSFSIEEMLGKAKNVFQIILQLSPQNVIALNNLGKAYQLSANLVAAKKGHLAGINMLKKAQGIYAEILQQYKDDVFTIYNCGLAESKLGSLHAATGNFDESLDAFKKARTFFDQAIKTAPHFLDYHQKRGDVYLGCGILLHSLNQAKDALECFAEAVASFDEALKIRENNSHSLYHKGQALWYLGKTHIILDDKTQGLWSYQHAEECYQKLLAYDAKQFTVLKNLADVRFSIAELQETFSQYGDALNNLKLALDDYDKYLEENGDDEQAAFSKALSLTKKGELHEKKMAPALAIKAYHSAKSIYHKITQNNTNIVNVYFHLGKTLESVGKLHLKASEENEAKLSFQAAIAAFSHPADGFASNPDIAYRRGNAHVDLGELLTTQEYYDMAISHFSKAITSFDVATGNGGDRLACGYQKANAFSNLGEVYTGAHRLDQALQAFEQAGKEYDKLLEMKSNFLDAHVEKGLCLMKMAQIYESQEKPENARSFYKFSYDQLSHAYALKPSDITIFELRQQIQEKFHNLEDKNEF